MKTKIALLFLTYILAISSCSPDKIEPTRTCGVITNMGFNTDTNKINHFYIEVKRDKMGNVYETYEVSKSEFDKILSTYMINSSNEVLTEDCFVAIKLVVSRVTNEIDKTKWTKINTFKK